MVLLESFTVNFSQPINNLILLMASLSHLQLIQVGHFTKKSKYCISSLQKRTTTSTGKLLNGCIDHTPFYSMDYMSRIAPEQNENALVRSVACCGPREPATLS